MYAYEPYVAKGWIILAVIISTVMNTKMLLKVLYSRILTRKKEK